MAVFKRGGVWWYKFYFAGQFIRESTKSTSKTLAKDAENQRRRELEQGFHNLKQRRENRVRLLGDVAVEYLADYRLRFRGITFAEYATHASAGRMLFSRTLSGLRGLVPLSRGEGNKKSRSIA
jgi:hypothetical protein